MTIPPIAPSSVLGPEWQMPAVDPAAQPASGGGFGDVLAQQVGNLSNLQENAATAAQSLADGTATDVSSVVTAVEKAQLAMQLAGQIRTRGAEAINDIFHTQI
ncbi:MAG TPA: flagellar hook-basal body complex protein FliE [Conexibacter sp.]|nr:flagellar hook-basal body complex protein FliE [Conexibacter sp.]